MGNKITCKTSAERLRLTIYSKTNFSVKTWWNKNKSVFFYIKIIKRVNKTCVVKQNI